MINSVSLDFTCSACGAGVALEQVDVGVFKVRPCRNCIKAKVVQLIRKKETEFLGIYDQIEASAIGEDPPQ